MQRLKVGLFVEHGKKNGDLRSWTTAFGYLEIFAPKYLFVNSHLFFIV
jgi:hypothetical protein